MRIPIPKKKTPRNRTKHRKISRRSDMIRNWGAIIVGGQVIVGIRQKEYDKKGKFLRVYKKATFGDLDKLVLYAHRYNLRPYLVSVKHWSSGITESRFAFRSNRR